MYSFGANSYFLSILQMNWSAWITRSTDLLSSLPVIESSHKNNQCVLFSLLQTCRHDPSKGVYHVWL